MLCGIHLSFAGTKIKTNSQRKIYSTIINTTHTEEPKSMYTDANKDATFEWIVYPPPSENPFRHGDAVFIRTKSKKEIGRKGHITIGPAETSSSEGKKTTTLISSFGSSRIEVKIPISIAKGSIAKDEDNDNKLFYTASFRPNRLISVFDTSVHKCTVILTKTTSKYRLLAASQLEKYDRVLEIGCSNGECSLIISKYVSEGNLVGIDVSEEMILQAKKKHSTAGYKHAQFHRVDPFTQPRKVILLSQVENSPAGDEDDRLGRKISDLFKKPNVIFIDIGGNRDLNSVIQMLAWVRSSFSPRLIIVKSEEMVENIECACDYAKNQSHSDEESTSKYTVKIDSFGKMWNGEEWFLAKLSALESHLMNQTASISKFSHPKKAPLQFCPDDEKTPICRYHNYHKNGCCQIDCPYDHNYCHWCLRKGHNASNCQNLVIKA